MKKPYLLMILDGWGLNDNLDQKNAIRDAAPENFNRYWKEFPHSTLEASGEAVGLPEGQMGNSEVGHLNIGAGRVVYQPLVKISKDIREKKMAQNQVIIDMVNHVKTKKTKLHLIGLLSDGGVHSHIDHLIGLVETFKEMGVTDLYIHAILDGRDTPPKSALTYIEKLEDALKRIGLGRIATVAGRYYTMDRDNRWDRVEKGYDALVNGAGDKNFGAKKAVDIGYMEGITDEFIKPTVITDMAGNPVATIEDDDAVFCFNFRPDRAREITRAIVDDEFNGFLRTKKVKVNYVCMTQYDSSIKAPIVYPSEELSNLFGEIISRNGLKQFRTAETEKYAHVTFFFNGGKENEFVGEERRLVDSPKVATYDLQPEMSAADVAEGLIKRLDENIDDLLIVNFANPDMVGHTGNFEAAIKAVRAVDKYSSKVIEKVLEKDGVVFVTADHGNVDLMEDPVTHEPFTAHTTNKVPFIVISNSFKNIFLKDGKLADIAPTILKMMGIEIPVEMDGEVLIK